MIRPRPLIFSLLACAAAMLSPAARADLHYSFDTDAQGWTVFDGGDLSHQAAGGNPGGFLQIADSSSGDFRLVAPASALGNWAAYLGGTLSFDARNIDGEAPDWPEFGQITLGSGSTVLVVDGVAGDAPPADGQWHHYSTQLSTAVFGADLPSVLASLDTLYIKAEFHNGVSEVAGIDNIRITAVPEPGTAALLLSGLVAVATLARRRPGR
jgi:hypothetical protein